MASTASTIPITHVAGSSLRKDVGPDKTEFPSLPRSQPQPSSNKDDDGGEWEFIDDETTTPAPVSPLGVSFCPKTTKSVEQGDDDDKKRTSDIKMNPKILKHAVSSPDLREYVLESESEDSSSSEAEEGDGDEEGSSSVGVLVGDADATSDAGSSAVLVSGPPSVWSAAGGISFKDAILKNQKPAAASSSPAVAPKESQSSSNHHHHHHSHHSSHHKHKKVIKKVKPTFVVTPIKRASKSTGDLLGLLHDGVELDDDGDDEAILGDSDAMEYYGRKSAGAMNRKNGRKSRPDEAKRLQMTMAKKADQKRRQQQGGH